MAQTVRIPKPFRSFTHGEETVEIEATTVAGAIIELKRCFPELYDRMTDERGEIRRFINIYVNQEDIRFLKNKNTALKPDDEIIVVPDVIERDAALAAIAVAEQLHRKS